MSVLLLLLALRNATVTPQAPPGAIEATIRGVTEPLNVVLLVRDGDVWKEVDHRALDRSTRVARFDKLTVGVYQILVCGEESTERMATKVVIGTGDTRRAEITIDPATVTGRVTFGDTALGLGKVLIRHKEHQWRAQIIVAGDGTFSTTFWQRGSYLFSVSGESLTTSFGGMVDLEGASPIRFPIEIPNGRITGVVRDAGRGTPVRGASVALRIDTARGSQHVSTLSDRVGRFDFNGLPFGRHTIKVVSAAHLEPTPIVIDLDGVTLTRAIDIKLDAGRTIPIVVMDVDDHPIVNATVFAVFDARRRSRATTDEKGSVHLAVPKNETSVVFVIPNEGGFGAMQITPSEQGRLTLHLPRPSSSLRIRARTTSDKAMPPFSLLMLYEGELMPPEIADELTALQGLQFSSNGLGEIYLHNIPAGRYEFWPYRTAEEAESILAAGHDVAPPIGVDVHAGENSIVVKFAAR